MSEIDLGAVKHKALCMLDRLREMQQAGSGELQVADLLALFGTPTGAELEKNLLNRGSIKFQFADAGAGSFGNEGPAFSAPYGPGELVFPRKISGKVKLKDNEAVLEFAQKETIVGKAFLIELKLQRIEISDHHAALRLPGGLFDQEIHF